MSKITHIDPVELNDLARHVVKALDAVTRKESEQAEARRLVKEARDGHRQRWDALAALLGEFRAAMPSGEELSDFLARIRDARAAELSALGRAEDAGEEYRRRRRATERAMAKVAGLVDSIDGMPLIDYALANGQANGTPDPGEPFPAVDYWRWPTILPLTLADGRKAKADWDPKTGVLALSAVVKDHKRGDPTCERAEKIVPEGRRIGTLAAYATIAANEAFLRPAAVTAIPPPEPKRQRGRKKATAPATTLAEAVP